MVKVEVVQDRLKQLHISLEKLKRYTHLSFEQFLEDSIAQDVVEYNLFISINMMVDIAVHIVVDNRLGNIHAMGEAFEILYREKYISKEEMVQFKNMVAFRNILSHEYININKKIVYNILQQRLSDFQKFILMVHEKFL